MGISSLVTVPLSWVFGLLVGLKNLLYDRGILKQTRLSAPVISVGNLAMGGTGKSPVTADLVARALRRGLRVAVLSRGYGRRQPKQALRVETDGDWRDVGDEPMMLARRAPEAHVCVGPTRAAAARIPGDTPIDLYIVDDGFQHRQLARDLDLVLIDVTKGMPRLFPRALFRERLGALRRAHGVVLTRWDGHDPLTQWRRAVAAIDAELPVMPLRYARPRLCDLDGRDLDLSEIRDANEAAFAGIADPDQFFAMLGSLGIAPRLTLALRDHEPFAGETAARFTERCLSAGVTCLITTEKDAVKLEKTRGSAILIAFLAIDVAWQNEEQIERLLDRVSGVSKGQI